MVFQCDRCKRIHQEKNCELIPRFSEDYIEQYPSTENIEGKKMELCHDCTQIVIKVLFEPGK